MTIIIVLFSCCMMLPLTIVPLTIVPLTIVPLTIVPLTIVPLTIVPLTIVDFNNRQKKSLLDILYSNNLSNVCRHYLIHTNQTIFFHWMLS